MMAPIFAHFMPVKDYYKMLEVAPGATQNEIKKSFRKLALRFHPDTNQGNKYSEAWFRELQEAYDVLTDPIKKDAYLQDRWLQQSMGRAMVDALPLTPPTLLKEAREVAKKVAHIDHFRMDHQGLANNILTVLSDEKMDALLSYNDKAINYQIADLLLQACSPLEYKFLPPVFQLLKRLAATNSAFLARLQFEEKKRKQEQWWSKNQWWVMLLATAVLCGSIYLFSRK